MKVCVIRGGGVAGVSRRTELDQENLSPDDAEILAGKVRDAGLRAQPPAEARPWPDQLLYELVVVDGAAETRARFSDQTLPEGARLLVEWVDSRPERTERLGG